MCGSTCGGCSCSGQAKSIQAQPLQFNVAQRIVLANYDEGAVSFIRTRHQLEECGDTLLLFLMKELATSEDCESVEDAYNRVESAISQLQGVSKRLREAADAGL